MNGGCTLVALDYADDIVLVTDKLQGMQRALDCLVLEKKKKGFNVTVQMLKL